MIADHDPPLEPIGSVQLWILQQKRNEGLDLEDLRRLFHKDVVVLEASLDKVLAL